MKRFYPDLYRNSTYELEFETYYELGYRAIIFDIDNTLVPHGAKATPEAIALFQRLKNIGFSCMLMSNNKEPRVKSFAMDVGELPYIYKANKPLKTSYLSCMKQMGSEKEHTLFVGDQLFTDVLGAKRCGIYSILVVPIDKKEEIQIILKRYLEKFVLYFYKKEINKC